MDLLSASTAVSHSDPKSTADLFKEFLNERRFLKNVTPATLEWYDTAWKALQRAQRTESPTLTKSALQRFVVSLRERDVKPVSCNTVIKALNAFCLRAHTEGHLFEGIRRLFCRCSSRGTSDRRSNAGALSVALVLDDESAAPHAALCEPCEKVLRGKFRWKTAEPSAGEASRHRMSRSRTKPRTIRRCGQDCEVV
jgi:hypothetical protein